MASDDDSPVDENKCSQCQGTGKCSRLDNMTGFEQFLTTITTMGLSVLAAAVEEECNRCGGTGRV